MADEDAPPPDSESAPESDVSGDAEVPDVADTPDTPETREERIEVALDLIAHLEHEELALSAVVDRIETVTSDPALTREILDTAEMRGLIDRDGARVRTRTGGTFVRFESQVVTREGEFDCRRCGASISTGHFVRFESGELGPFGSSCVRKVTGRE
nr:DUF5830 family protein [Salinirubrum litoreum]